MTKKLTLSDLPEEAQERARKQAGPDPVSNLEIDRKRKDDLEILLAVGTVKDRQAAEKQPTANTVTLPKKRGILSKLVGMIWGYILAWWRAPHTRGGAFDTMEQTTRPRKRKAPARQPAPIRLKKMQWKDPDVEEFDFDDSAFNRKFESPRF